MDLPEEDKTAIAKRRAIRAVMSNKSLSAPQRHKEMQEIMRGNFTMDDYLDEGDGDGGDGSEDDSGDDSGSYADSYSERSRNSSDYDDSSYLSTEGDTRSEATSDRSSMGSMGEFDSSLRSGRSYASEYSRGSAPRRSSHVSGVSESSRSSHENENSGSWGSGRDNNALRSAVNNAVSRRGSSDSSASGSTQNKDKQRALLEISRDKTLSAKERQAKMKQVMQTPVRGLLRRSGSGRKGKPPSGETDTGNDGWEARVDRRASLTKGSVAGAAAAVSQSGQHMRRPARKISNRQKDSVREAPATDDLDIRPTRISRRRITENVMEIKDIVDRIARNDPNLKKIELQKMNLTDEDVIPLLDALGDNGHLNALDLRRNRIGIEGCSTLASAILDNRTLTSIDISGNNLGDEGLEDLSKVIPYNRTLRTLNIEDNKIADAGAKAFAESLGENKALQEINLSGNLIGDAGAGNLFKVMGSTNSTVTSLLLRFNAISDKGATELASALLDNESLRVVDLGHNKITNTGAKDLLKVVSINDTLEVLEMGGNVGIDEDMLDKIQRALEEEEDSDDMGDETESASEDGGAESSYSEMEEMSENTESLGMEDEDHGDDDGDGGGDDYDDNDAQGAGPTREGAREDSPEGDDDAMAKRQRIQRIMRDKSLNEVERNRQVQEVMTGTAEVPGAAPRKERLKAVETTPPLRARQWDESDESSYESDESSYESDESSYESDESSYESESVESFKGDVPPQVTAPSTVEGDMPDEDDTTLAKRRAIQGLMRDQSLSVRERNKKIQAIMAGKVELPRAEKMPPPLPKPHAKAEPLSQRNERAREDESESSYGSESDKSTSSEKDRPQNVASGTASSPGNEAQLTGAEAMLEDMADENDTVLAKRKAIQSVMRDTSLSNVEKNKKMQDIMAGKVELPKVEKKQQAAVKPPAKPLANQSQPAASHRRSQEVRNSDSSEVSYSDDSPRSAGGTLSSSAENNHTNVPAAEKATASAAVELTGAEAMLRDMPDESDKTLAKRRAIQEVMKDKSLTQQQRTKKIQAIMAGRMELPPAPRPSAPVDPPSSASPKKSRAAEASFQTDKKKEAVVSARSFAAPRRQGEADEKKPMSQQQMNATKKGKDELTSSQPPSRRQRSKEAAAKAKNKTHKMSSTPGDPDDPNSDISLSRRGADMSYDGGMRPAIAHEWKRSMMAVHPRSHDNMLDVLLAHKYRLSLKFPPCQSFFRVVAVVFFSRVVDGVRRSERYHVVGTNDEPHNIGGSICAERAALMQLRFIPDVDCITKVVIVSDDADAITPGMLCREFMASHNRIPWDVPIVLGRSVCRNCGFTVSGKVLGDDSGGFNEEMNEALRDASANLFGICTGHDETSSAYPTPHDFVGTTTTLRDLFPYPSVYARMDVEEAKKFGESHLGNSAAELSSDGGQGTEKARTAAFLAGRQNRRFSDDQSVASYRQERFDLSMLTNIMEEDEDEEEGGVQNNTVNGDEMSLSTMERSARRKAASLSSVKSSMSSSLKTTIDFMKHLREDRPDGLCINGQKSHGSKLDMSSTPNNSLSQLDHLTARTLRISHRLKLSQRREKLMRLATEVTALETLTNQGIASNAHPIRYGAAVLFSDGTVAIAAQKVAIEYGCTLDAVGQLASVIDRKSIQLEEEVPPCRPIMLVQCDQFGIAHAPFAQGRSFLTERGYGDVKVLLHQQRQPKGMSNGTREDLSTEGDGEAEESGKNYNGKNANLRLLEVRANDLAPSPPDIFGRLIDKNHTTRGGLQIQF